MSKRADRGKTLWRVVFSLLSGAAVYALLCFLIAQGVQSEWIPMEALRAAATAALVLSAAAIAAVGRGGKEGLLLGASFAALYLIWRFASGGMKTMRSETGLSVLICFICPWLFSCIFHKGNRKNTKRNQKKRR